MEDRNPAPPAVMPRQCCANFPISRRKMFAIWRWCSLKIAHSFSSGLITQKKSKSRRDERNLLPSLTGLTKLTDVSPRHKWLGYFREDVRTCFAFALVSREEIFLRA